MTLTTAVNQRIGTSTPDWMTHCTFSVRQLLPRYTSTKTTAPMKNGLEICGRLLLRSTIGTAPKVLRATETRLDA